MKVYSLTGPSGTGKSYNCINLCQRKNIESFIDDGLFVYKNQVLGGISAKREPTAMGAIKTAIFTKEEHCQQVKKQIQKVSPKSILILGTSDRMAEKIVERLGLPPISERIYIEDISSKEDIDRASRERRDQGKHIIPVPTLQLKRDFSGYFLDPMKFIRERSVGEKCGESEKTVVRPTYSYIGDFYISDTVFTNIAQCVGKNIEGINQVVAVYENNLTDNLHMKIVIDVDVNTNFYNSIRLFQEKVATVVEEMTAYNVSKIDMEIRA